MRHGRADAFERMKKKMLAHREMMVNRRPIVEHLFGNLKQWLFGIGRFLLRQLGERESRRLRIPCLSSGIQDSHSVLINADDHPIGPLRLKRTWRRVGATIGSGGNSRTR